MFGEFACGEKFDCDGRHECDAGESYRCSRSLDARMATCGQGWLGVWGHDDLSPIGVLEFARSEGKAAPRSRPKSDETDDALRSEDLEDRPSRWKHSPEETRQSIGAFDAISFVPNGKAADALT
jgi:hypothetical protein